MPQPNISSVEQAPKENIYDAFARHLRMEVASGNATDDTVAAYYREVAVWVKWCEGRGVAPEDAQQYHIEAYREEMKRRGLSVATRTHKLSIIRQFYESAIQAELREDNPAGKVWDGKDLSEPEERFKILSEEALAQLIESLPSEGLAALRDRLVVALMAVHGLRRVEVHRLEHSHVQLNSIQSEAGFLIVDGKAHRLRRIQLRPDVWRALMTYTQAKVNAGYDTRGAVFVGHSNNGRGSRLSRVSINAIVDKCLEAAHLKKDGVSCQSLRQTFGTLAITAGAKADDVRDAMGYSTMQTTNLYVKAAEKGKKDPSYFINVEL